jgi:hypothetical protein
MRAISRELQVSQWGLNEVEASMLQEIIHHHITVFFNKPFSYPTQVFGFVAFIILAILFANFAFYQILYKEFFAS